MGVVALAGGVGVKKELAAGVCGGGCAGAV